MRAFLLLLPAVAAASCSTGYHWRSGEFRDYYSTPGKKTESQNLDRKKIYYTVDRGKLQFLGILEKNEIRVKGSRDARSHYNILDRHFRKVGFISEEGEFSRYDGSGRLQSVGEFPILMKGLKVFFGFPLFSRDHEYQIFLQPIDPYGDF